MKSWKSNESVVARLMGLDDLRPQEESIPKKKSSVFSDSYLCRVASIGIGHKRSLHEYRSRIVEYLGDEHLDPKSFSSGSGWSLNNKKPRNSFTFQGSRRYLNSIDDCFEENTPKKINLFSNNADDMPFYEFVISHSGDKIVSKPPSFSKSRRREYRSPKPLQKLENGIATGTRGKQRFGSFHNTARPHSGFRKCRDFCGPDRLRDSDVSLFGESRSQFSENPPMGDSVDFGPNFFMAKDCDSRPRNTKLKNSNHGLKYPYLNKVPKQVIKYEAFRSKWRLRSGRSIDLARLKPVAFKSDDLESRDTKLKFVKYKSLASWDSEDFLSYSGSKNNNRLLRTWTRKRDVKTKFDDCNDVGYARISLSSTMPEDRCNCSSRPTCGHVQQQTLVDFHDECSPVKCCYDAGLDSLVFPEEAFHPSPISVLELPFNDETMNEIDELRRHLELLKSEIHIEEPEMVVSSDDENERGTDDSGEDSNALMEVCRVEKSRKFSYLVDVLAEASMNGRNLVDYSTWHSLDCPMSLSVFEDLEKKYGDRTSMKRSTRRLLFDRMNTGLTEILVPCFGARTSEASVVKRVRNIWYDEALKEVLWELLVRQEKECSKYTVQKTLESELGRLDLGDEIGAIVGEIARLLFDELLAELC